MDIKGSCMEPIIVGSFISEAGMNRMFGVIEKKLINDYSNLYYSFLFYYKKLKLSHFFKFFQLKFIKKFIKKLVF